CSNSSTCRARASASITLASASPAGPATPATSRPQARRRGRGESHPCFSMTIPILAAIDRLAWAIGFYAFCAVIFLLPCLWQAWKQRSFFYLLAALFFGGGMWFTGPYDTDGQRLWTCSLVLAGGIGCCLWFRHKQRARCCHPARFPAGAAGRFFEFAEHQPHFLRAVRGEDVQLPAGRRLRRRGH